VPYYPRLVGYIGSILALGVKRIPRMYQLFGRSTQNFREIDTGEVRRILCRRLPKKSLSGVSSADMAGTPQQNEPLLPRFVGF
jgi:hypothetical protein